MMRIFALLLVVILVASLPLLSNWLTKNDKNVDRTIIEAVVADYIKDHPKEIMDSVNRFQMETVKKEMNDVVLDNQQDLYDLSYPFFGNRDSKVTVVEFFDYSCGYCKVMSEDVRKLIADGRVRYVFRDLPVLGEASIKAARSGLAVHLAAPEKYLDFYYAALSHQGRLTDTDIAKIIEGIGLSYGEFEASLTGNSDEIDSMLDKTRKLSTDLHIKGTPSLVVGDSLFVGATDIDALNKKIDELLK